MRSFALLTATVAVITGTSAAAVSQQAGPNTTCGNIGLQYAYYTDNYAFPNNASYDGYNPTVLKHSHAIKEKGVTGAILYSHYGADSTGFLGSAPKNQSLPDTFFAINYRGYVYANVTGYYQFLCQDVDDMYFLWVGKYAYSGWNRQNANTIAHFNRTAGKDGYGSYSVKFTAGNYYPFRVVFKHGAGDAVIDLNILDPNDVYLLGNVFNGTQPTDKVVQYSCDGKAAPPFPAYGSES